MLLGHPDSGRIGYNEGERRLSRRTAFITGATNGVGRVVAERLGALGWDVLVHGRDERRGEELANAIVGSGGRARFFRGDLASLAQVRKLAGAIMSASPRMHLMINNAGVGFGPPGAMRETTEDGLELRFAVNYLAPFVLTRTLLPNLIAATPARIVNVESIGQSELDFEDMQFEHGFSGIESHRRSKLALIMFTIDLAAELVERGVTVNAVHPASYMDTFMVRQTGSEPRSTVAEGADAIMNLASSLEAGDRTDQYFDQLTPTKAKAQAYDRQAPTELVAKR
ncbi:SDR family NAD(P)-dependent oxidoreductase [Bradyrhizobium sp. CW7]|nr:SDR family NAD(P)-dependent oxidoreductase [Bradyrhizobium sp. CW7]